MRVVRHIPVALRGKRLSRLDVMVEVPVPPRAQSERILLAACGDLADARHSWEVPRVNEMLTRMKGFGGVFIALTNLMGDTDPAAPRAST